ncbi:hypothetical protein ACFGVS_01010 [Mucilaginibacter sp. AW1-7]|uniref:hypothetical protein n=1 Tax=Mucilaginibacter sp. AW1-7 TaxID=3349874 RepID=UPI003F73DD97
MNKEIILIAAPEAIVRPRLLFRAAQACGRLAVCLLLLLVSIRTCTAKTVLTWTGVLSSDWNNAGNWSPAMVPGASDEVEIGLSPFGYQPLVSSATQCSSLLLGNKQPLTLTIAPGAAMVVSGFIKQGHGGDDAAGYTIIAGGGSLTCGSLIVGDGIPGKIIAVKTTRLIAMIANFTVSGDVLVNSVTSFLLSGGLSHNDGYFSLVAGQMTIYGQVRLTNSVPVFLSGLLAESRPAAMFHIDITAGQHPGLKLFGNISFVIANPVFDTVDLYNLTGTGTGLVEYAGGNQIVASRSLAGLDLRPKPYQNLVISGSGVKKTAAPSGDSLNVDGYLAVHAGTLDLQTNNAYLSVGGNFSNAGTVNLNRALFLGEKFSNTATITSGNDTIRFRGGNQVLSDTTATGTALKNVRLVSGTKTISSGGFIILPGGVWRVADNATMVSIAPGAQLVLRSDAGGQSGLVFAGQDPGPE